MTRPLALVILAGMSTLLGGEAHRRTEKGNALYLKGQAEPALSEYQKAQAAIPEAPQLHYDIGNVLYRQENWAGAAEAYEHALGVAGPDLSSRAAYNLGNALYHDEKYDDAVKAYTRALKGAPQDADAKHNLEMALRALELKKQQQKQQSKSDQKQDQNQDQQQQQQQQQGSGSPKDDAKPKHDKSAQSGPKEPGKQPDPKSGGMTPQEAEKLLDRLKDQEKENVKNAQARRPKDSDTPEKDW
jgi:Ca-activated chloride channel family protein